MCYGVEDAPYPEKCGDEREAGLVEKMQRDAPYPEKCGDERGRAQ